jgi:hypothetical protein
MQGMSIKIFKNKLDSPIITFLVKVMPLVT